MDLDLDHLQAVAEAALRHPRPHKNGYNSMRSDAWDKFCKAFDSPSVALALIAEAREAESWHDHYMQEMDNVAALQEQIAQKYREAERMREELLKPSCRCTCTACDYCGGDQP
jgi:hypothetical protein